MRSTRAASESTTGTPGASESPAARGGRAPRARSGTFSGVSSGKASPCWLLLFHSRDFRQASPALFPWDVPLYLSSQPGSSCLQH